MPAKALLSLSSIVLALALSGPESAQAERVKKLDAGPDVFANFPGPVTLVGTVYDDEPPYLAIGWMVDAGPGDVIFENGRSAVTTATFTTPGEYTLALGGYDGDVAYDTVVVTVR